MAGVLYVYQDANLTKQLKTLNSATCDPKLMGRLTRYGEARIKNCIKFDLVRGYRLVGMMLNRGIAFLYVGSHDECDHWIRNNSGLEPVLDKKRNKVVAVEAGDAVETRAQNELEDDASELDYDRMLFRDLMEQDLRKIFCGLVRKSSAFPI